MKRSAKVTAPLLASVALAITTGCRKPEMQRCVDENNKVVDDKLCANQPQAGGQTQNLNGPGYVPYIPLYHYYYGGWGGYGLGTLAGGGSTTPAEGHSYINSSGVRTGTVRGGFGRSMSSGGSSGAGE
ncbi:hypothetical protein [Edaphobacter aggregans]|uniref:hypothetical protein n=1 Tax=Edaphobacter aggregans TaxID=570835 RepID=UPI00055383EB|nr:hypothetical protein [Edaphobacter aggregans]